MVVLVETPEQPASTAAREAPTAAPNLSAKSYNNLKLSPDFKPRPPETITLALVNSGRSDFVSSWLTNSLREFAKSPDGAFSILPLPPAAATAAKLVPRTVMTLTGSFERNVRIALPAYMVRTNVSSAFTSIISEIGETSNLAAKRGNKFLPKAVAPAKMCISQIKPLTLHNEHFKIWDSPALKAECNC
uniref:Uncharacterized protein n=1 Tax=Glossina austeni TaxID=7395 RepID=A0A1A9V1T9_GLOAU